MPTKETAPESITEPNLRERFDHFIGTLGDKVYLSSVLLDSELPIHRQRVDNRNLTRVWESIDWGTELRTAVHRSYYSPTPNGSFEETAGATFSNEGEKGLFIPILISIKGEDAQHYTTLEYDPEVAERAFIYSLYLAQLKKCVKLHIDDNFNRSGTDKYIWFDNIPNEGAGYLLSKAINRQKPFVWRGRPSKGLTHQLVIDSSFNNNKILSALTTPLLRTNPFDAYSSDDLKSWLSADYQDLFGVDWNIFAAPLKKS